jgi:hypothetical protein
LECFLGDNGHLVLNGGGYRRRNPEAIHFKLPPGGQEVYRTTNTRLQHDHKADGSKRFTRASAARVDIEIGHRTATLAIWATSPILAGTRWG